MDYSKKKKELLSLYKLEDVSWKYPLANDFENCILIMRNAGWSYSEIQKPLGMPSKKAIRAVLKDFNPELIEMDVNRKKLSKKQNISLEEGEFRFNCIQSNQWDWNLQGEDYHFFIKDNLLYLTDSDNYTMPFSEFDETGRKQFCNEQHTLIYGNKS